MHMNSNFLPSQNVNAIALPWDEFISHVLKSYGPPKARKTAVMMGSVLRQLQALGAETTASLTIAFISDYVASLDKKVSRRTIAGRLAYVRAACQLGVADGFLRVNPFWFRPAKSFVRVPKPKPGPHHSREELKRVRDLLEQRATQDGWPGWRAARELALFMVYAFAGLRYLEALFLQVEDLDLHPERRIIWVRSRQDINELKTITSEAPVPCALPLADALRTWLARRLQAPPGFKIDPACPWVFPGVRRNCAWTGGELGSRPRDRIKAAAFQAGVENVTPQSIRRSLSVHLEAAGMSDAQIARILRHSPRVDREWYRGADLPNLRDSIDRFEL
jgi:integrase